MSKYTINLEDDVSGNLHINVKPIKGLAVSEIISRVTSEEEDSLTSAEQAVFLALTGMLEDQKILEEYEI